MEEKRIISIRETHYKACLASGIEDEQVQLFEGTWYFNADLVDMTNLVITERTYICPYKGVCYWIDLNAPEHQAENVAFTYFDVNPGYEFIKDKIGFYAGRQKNTYQETSTLAAGQKQSN